VSGVEEHLCANCGASLPPTGTFCLACDTPVSPERSALSVSETFVAERGRPLRAVAWILGAAVLVGGVVYAFLAMTTSHSNGQASNAAIHGVLVLVRSEGGHSAACSLVSTTLSGDAAANLAACKAVADSHPGAVIKRLHAVSTDRSGDTGTVELRGTWVDKSGRSIYEHTVHVVNGEAGWLLSWDGKALSPTG
jgi:hypothetical protein